MRRRSDSPRSNSLLSTVSALGLTVATLFSGAWEASGHGHDPATENAGRCTVEYDAEIARSPNRAVITSAAAPHDHSCLACELGRSKTTANGGAAGLSPRDRLPAAEGIPSKGRPQTGERWQQTARGPPRV